MTQRTFADWLDEQAEWSATTFGRSRRTVGILKHIEKEVAEVRAAPQDVEEWIDIAILAFDGAMRLGFSGQEVLECYVTKLNTNFRRKFKPVAEIADNEPSEHLEA